MKAVSEPAQAGFHQDFVVTLTTQRPSYHTYRQNAREDFEGEGCREKRVAQSLCISDSAVFKLNTIHSFLIRSAMTRRTAESREDETRQCNTLTHTPRYHAQTRTVGYGHVYQGRYKSLPVERDDHFLALVRYVERNAKRAALVKKAEDWPWSSAHVRLYGKEKQQQMLSSWPVPAPEPYGAWLNQSQGKEEIENLRYALKRSKPYGSEQWVAKAVAQFGLENTLRNPGRPRNGT